MKLFHKSSEIKLSYEEANRILQKAFEANGMEVNSVPLEALASYSNYRRERFTLQRTILVIIMILFILLPLLFIPAAFHIDEDETLGRNYNPVYRLEVDSLMLVDRVSAVIDGKKIPVYEAGSHVYSIEPSGNGQMAVTVTLINGQTMTQYVDVTRVDREVPTVVSCTKVGDKIHLFLSDDGSGVDFSQIEVLGLDGEKIEPVSVNEKTGLLILPAAADAMNVFIADLAGNKLQVILTTE